MCLDPKVDQSEAAEQQAGPAQKLLNQEDSLGKQSSLGTPRSAKTVTFQDPAPLQRGRVDADKYGPSFLTPLPGSLRDCHGA
jgi:hypothetical protein